MSARNPDGGCWWQRWLRLWCCSSRWGIRLSEPRDAQGGARQLVGICRGGAGRCGARICRHLHCRGRPFAARRGDHDAGCRGAVRAGRRRRAGQHRLDYRRDSGDAGGAVRRARLGAQALPARGGVVDKGIAKDGAVYLLSLRLAPIFPFFLVNLAMGLTAMPVARYALVTWAGALPGTIAYTFAGTQLAQIARPSDALSPDLARGISRARAGADPGQMDRERRPAAARA